MLSSKVEVTVDGESHIHAVGNGLYATLCGLDGEDYATEPARPRQQITCPQCFQLWDAWRAYRAEDFSPKIRAGA
jgi:hypothetical protein